MSKPIKVLLLVHPQMRPDRADGGGATEGDVWAALGRLGHIREVCAVQDDADEFERRVNEFKPNVVFNLLEEFLDEGVFDFHLVTRLESRGIAYTGCNPRGLIVSRNKVWANHIAAGCGVPTPNYYGGRDKINFPVFVKYSREHASRGITAQNKVGSASELRKLRTRMRGQFNGHLLVQEFIPGVDVTVPVFGNNRPQALQPWILHLGGESEFATERLKFSAKWRKRAGIRATRFRGKQASAMQRAAIQLYSACDLSGYARVDFRLAKDGKFYFIDINANPNLARNEDFASAAKLAGFTYDKLIQRILELARSYSPKT